MKTFGVKDQKRLFAVLYWQGVMPVRFLNTEVK